MRIEQHPEQFYFMSKTSRAVSLSVSKLAKRYGDFEVIKDLDLEVRQSAIHGLVGLNGSGKTTTLECILGLQLYNSGTISVLGKPPSHLYEAAGKIVGIFDTPSLYPNLTVRQCLEHASLLCPGPVRTPEKVEQVLGIEKFRNFKIKNLSLGNKRRASIAQGLLGHPEIILLDEPFNGLDAEGVDDVISLIKTLNERDGTTFLLSSHQLPYLEQICSHIAILHQGRIVVSDEIDKLFSHDKTRLRLKCDDNKVARELIAATESVEIESTDADGYLHLALENVAAADLNRHLVEAKIAVSELVIKRDSLGSLFRKITSEQQP
jgi:ABC-type multidrug transport system ATPase subunit